MKTRLRKHSFLKLEKFIKPTHFKWVGRFSALVSGLSLSLLLGSVTYAQSSGKAGVPPTVSSHTQSGAAVATGVSEELKTQLKNFLAPEQGLNNEIRSGLARIEQACEIAKTKAAAPAPMHNKSALISKEISATKELIEQQQAQLDKAFSAYRASHALSGNSCSAMPSFLRISEQCVKYQRDLGTVLAVSDTAQNYYAEALARLKSYEAAIDLEARGCTRSDFAFKLWSAEQVHITPKLKTSAASLSALLN